ncbi:hypothetical protein F7725_023055 [Dissostichus mawsoni]|uniref:Alpha-2-macroglobulin bait region domain-containing protein n=1 Tax=Dissostichus mawsoni TaxID=36200 RepID=A0A7J5YZZ3_DISMA|nr:hypothetical protein F7725_023055 [Dissostichus mawsoni]
MSKKTKILIERPAFIHIIQTDKPIYKPGQKVQFRIVSMDSNFIPVARLYKVVELQDPNSNRIAQWLDRNLVSGILDIAHPMIPEAVQGSYVITATTDQGEKIFHSFDIKEYVLPKYEVKVELPNVISILDKEATLKICGKYTYGKPVVGSVKAVFCKIAPQMFWFSRTKEKDICKTYELTTDKAGCATQTVNLAVFQLNWSMNDVSFVLNAELEEYGTGTGRTSFSTIVRTVTFEDVPEAYKPGILFEGKVKVIGPDNKAVTNEAVYVSAGNSQAVKLTTGTNGKASFSFDTALWKDNVNGKLACDKDATVRAQYIIQGTELKNDQEILQIFYMVLLSPGASSREYQAHLQAHPGSMCSVRAIDQSVLLLQKEQELTVDSVYSRLPVQKLSGYSYELADAEPNPCKFLPVPWARVKRLDSRPFYFPENDQKNDVYNIFKGIGIKIVTNSDIRKPYDCHPWVYYNVLDSPILMARPMANKIPQSPGGKEEQKKETLRTFFPETWIWDLVSVG